MLKICQDRRIKDSQDYRIREENLKNATTSINLSHGSVKPPVINLFNAPSQLSTEGNLHPSYNYLFLCISFHSLRSFHFILSVHFVHSVHSIPFHFVHSIPFLFIPFIPFIPESWRSWIQDTLETRDDFGSHGSHVTGDPEIMEIISEHSGPVVNLPREELVNAVSKLLIATVGIAVWRTGSWKIL